MIQCHISHVQPGMTIAQTINSSNGGVLIAAGVVLNEHLISRLNDMGVCSLYIAEDGLESSCDMPEAVSEQIRVEAVQNVRSVYDSLKCKRQLNVEAIGKTVDSIMDEIGNNQDVIFACNNIHRFDDYLFNHCVNVCILSLMMATNLGYNELKLRELGTGAILHDIGMIGIDSTILNKSGELTTDEFAVVKQHTDIGYKDLRNYDIPLLSAHVAYQHHECWNGTGYPRGLVGNDIHEYARIVAVADTFDALTADRPYRPAISLDEAIQYLTTMSNFHFDPRCVEALLANIITYPIGSVVKLNTGEVGQVLKINRSVPTRPLIRVVFDQNGNMLKPYQVDLNKDFSLQIVNILSDKDVSYLIRQVKKSS